MNAHAWWALLVSALWLLNALPGHAHEVENSTAIAAAPIPGPVPGAASATDFLSANLSDGGTNFVVDTSVRAGTVDTRLIAIESGQGAESPSSTEPSSSSAPQADASRSNAAQTIALCDQIVLASTRSYPGTIGRVLDFNTFVGYECDLAGCCTGRPVQLLESGGYAETWIFVHGNQIPSGLDVERGVRIYRQLRATRSCSGPIRFIIWSWPSERKTNRIADAKLKSRRIDAECFYLGSFLAATAGQGTHNIIGYSFGCRVVSGALHLAEGGTLCGRYLPFRERPPVPYRVAFLAAAAESDGFQRGGRYDRALNYVDSILLQNNSRDQALRFFWIMSKSKPKALGATGLACKPAHCRVQQFDWKDEIGRDHSVWQYVDRPPVVNRILQTFTR